MRKAIFIVVIFFVSFSNAQTVFLNKPFDLGMISKTSNGYIDIPIKNISNNKVFIFRAEVDRRFQIHYSNKEILPDSLVYMRVQFNPTEKGPFSEKIAVHFSCYTEPKIVEISGYVESVPSVAIACPSFNQQSINTSLEFDFEVKVIDMETKAPIPKANVLMLNNGIPKENIVVNSEGEAHKKVDLGLYYFVTTAEGYYSNEFVKYINRNNNFVLIELEKDSTAAIVPMDDVNITLENPTPIEDTIVEMHEESTIIVKDTVVVIEPSIETSSEEYPDFPLSRYKPNNIVFLVDVSSSMKYTGKLDLLKASMIELTGMLRDIDKITIVSYADNANVLLETTKCVNKDTIIKIIQSLEANGYTAGGKGMKKAYEKAEESFIKEGNNQVIMATDGGFNQGDDNPYKLAEKYKKKGISISIVGIKNKPLAEVTLQKVVRYGDGNYVKISSYEDAQNALVDEVKSSSKR